MSFQPEILDRDESQLTAPEEKQHRIDDLLNSSIKIYYLEIKSAQESTHSIVSFVICQTCWPTHCNNYSQF